MNFDPGFTPISPSPSTHQCGLPTTPSLLPVHANALLVHMPDVNCSGRHGQAAFRLPLQTTCHFRPEALTLTRETHVTSFPPDRTQVGAKPRSACFRKSVYRR